MPTRRPDRTEAAEYYFRYIDLVPDGDICRTLRLQRAELVSLFAGVDASMAGHRYADDKWTLRQVLGHVIDTERVFVMRAFWFARAFDSPMPSFDQDAAIAVADFDSRAWPGLVDECAVVRDASLALFDALPEDAWERQGIASGNQVTVRALAWITAGHAEHHAKIVRERYLAPR
jgi:hypothetical protein